MLLKRIEVHHVRNITHAILDDLGAINLVYGANGSGKTSLLEAIHLLCIGRSFRTRQFQSVVSHEADSATVYANASPDSGEAGRMTFGVQRTRAKSPQIKINGQAVQSLAELAGYFPMQVMNAQSFGLIEGGPSERRQFVDWGVFHVEQSYISHWQRTKKCIRQRNSMLRHGKMAQDQALGAWDRELVAHANTVDGYRQHYLDRLWPVVEDTLTRFPGLPTVRYRYERGWPGGQGLDEALMASREKDLQRGFTSCGPHRAEIRFTVGDKVAAEVLSRGQIKALVSVLRLSQARLLADETGRRCLFLIDDLPAELDGQHQRWLGRQLEAVGAQAFITGIGYEDIAGLWSEETAVQMFHVEHGRLVATV